MAGLQSSLEFLTSRLDTTVLARQWPSENYQHPVEYQESQRQHVEQPYPTTPAESNFSHDKQPTTTHEAVDKVATAVVDRPILSRTNSRGERSESPKVRKERRTLTRRESRMQIQKVDYPVPKHPNIELQQQPQRGTFSTDNTYRNENVSEPVPYRPETQELPQEYISAEPIPQEQYQPMDPYISQDQDIQGLAGQEYQQQQHSYPQEYNYPEPTYYENQDSQPNYYSSEADQYGSEPQFTRQEDRAPSRESLRRHYQEEMAQGYQPEGYRAEERAPSRESLRRSHQETPPNYPPEIIRQRKSSSGESTGAPQPGYGQQPEVFQPSSPELQQPLRQPSVPPEDTRAASKQPPTYQQPDVFQPAPPEQQQPFRQPSFAPEEVKTAAKPPQVREQPKQTRQQNVTNEVSDQKPPDVPRTKASPPSASARREAGTKLLQKMQRNVPTKFQ